MAFLQGIFGGGNGLGFGPAPKNDGQQGQQTQPQNGNGQNGPANPQAGNGSPQNNNGSGGPAGGQQNGGANTQVDATNPLDPFLALMTPSKDVQTQRQQQQEVKSKGLFGDSFTPEAVTKAMGSMDFTQGVDIQGLSQKVLAGDPAALAELLNSVTRNAVSASVQMSHGMVEKGVSTGIERFGGDMDSRMRDFSLRNQNVDNPALKHPVGKALLSTVSRQIAEANPRMSADEVHSKAVEMFTQFTGLMSSGQQDKNKKEQPAEMDWMVFADGADQSPAQH